MPGVSDEQIAAARSVDLLSYLQAHEPGSIKKDGQGEYCLVEHDSLKISNGKWFWFSRGFGGYNALDFLIKVRGLDFVLAVSTLTDGRAAPVYHCLSPSLPSSEKQKKLFALPLPNRNNHRAAAYLMGRGVNHVVIGHCLRAVTLYEDMRHNCVFVGKDSGGHARFACKRGTTGDYKKDVIGSDKRHNFSITAQDSSTLHVFEAPVDLLSFATLRQRDSADDWNNAHYLSLGGVSARALEQYLTDHPGIKSVFLCLDNDTPGRAATAKIQSLLSGKGYAVIDFPPPYSKDWNQYLQNTIKQEKYHGRPKEAAISI